MQVIRCKEILIYLIGLLDETDIVHAHCVICIVPHFICDSFSKFRFQMIVTVCQQMQEKPTCLVEYGYVARNLNS